MKLKQGCVRDVCSMLHSNEPLVTSMSAKEAVLEAAGAGKFVDRRLGQMGCG